MLQPPAKKFYYITVELEVSWLISIWISMGGYVSGYPEIEPGLLLLGGLVSPGVYKIFRDYFLGQNRKIGLFQL